MDRNRESRKLLMAAPTGLARRRHRGSGLRDSPDEDGAAELQETARLRDRKKERDRDREHRDRDRDRERSSRNKRRRNDRMMHAGNRDDVADDSSDESVNDEDEDDYEDDGVHGSGGGGSGSGRMLPPNPASTSSPSISNHHQNHHHRRTFTQPVSSSRMFRPASPWKPADQMIGVPIPRKARSASTKRPHDCWVAATSAGIIGGDRDQFHRQASMSPARSSLVSATASPSRISPSSSNISARIKMKSIGASNKPRPPSKQSSIKAASSSQDEIEFEIAEVLYGLRQPPGSSKPESGTTEAREVDRSASDSKSRVSSPVSNAAAPSQSNLTPTNAGSGTMVATVPKRKRPRPAIYGDENAVFSSQTNFISKPEMEQAGKVEIMSSNLERSVVKSVLANGRVSPELEHARGDSGAELKADLTKPVGNPLTESKNLKPEPIGAGLKDEDASSTKKDSSGGSFDEIREDNSKSTASGLEIKRDEKFQIDLMAPPPGLRLSPERDGNVEDAQAEPKKSTPDLDKDLKPLIKEGEKTSKLGAAASRNFLEQDRKKFKRSHADESDLQKVSLSKERYDEMQLNVEKSGVDRQPQLHKQQQQQQQALPHLLQVSTGEEVGDKTVHAASSLPTAMAIPSWQSGMPPLGYMAPLPGIVSMDGSTVAAAPIQPQQLPSNQPRKRCATHCYIAQNISVHQQFTRVNPFWPAAAGNAAALYGTKPCNLNVVPPVELHGSAGGRGVKLAHDKSLGTFPGSNNNKEKVVQGANLADAAQRKQILLQHTVPPPGTPSNLLRGPAFIFPLSQQQAAVAASALTTTMKNPPVPSSGPSGNSVTGSGTGPSTAPATMSFNYPPTMGTNETQYLAILQNSPYQFPFPAHVGTPPPVYRGTHPQAMPFFNGQFYSSQMLHPSQLQQQPQQSAPSNAHQAPAAQNTGISSGASSQKHLQNHTHKSQGNGSSCGTTNMKQSYPSPKNRPLSLPLQQNNQHLTEMGIQDSPSTADSRGSGPSLGMYTDNFVMPIHAQNFALMSAPSVGMSGGAGTANIVPSSTHKSSNHGEKKQQQQQHGGKAGTDTMPSHQGFAVSFSSLNGGATPPSMDITSMAQNHAILQNFPDAARHGYHVRQAAAAQQAHQKKNFQIVAGEVKKGSGGESLNAEERKSMASKGGLPNVGVSIAFSRPDLADSSPLVNNVVDSSTRNLKAVSVSGKTAVPLMSASVSNLNSFNSQQQQQFQHQQSQQQQKQQLIQLHKQSQQQYLTPSVRGKTPSVSNGSVYPDHVSTSAAMAAKMSNSLSTFQQNHASISSGSSSPTQSPQWKNSGRSTTSQGPSPSLASSNSIPAKNHYQPQSQLSQQSHMQISFGGGNQKPLTASQGQQLPPGHQVPSSHVMVGSPAPPGSYKSGGSPRTSTGGIGTNKAPQVSSLSSSASLQVKNSSMPSRSSSPVGARNVPSSLGNSNMAMPSGSSGIRPQLSHQQQQQQQIQHMQQQMRPQLSTKQSMQQAQQSLFPNYLQTSQTPNSTSTTTSVSPANSGYLQRRRPDQQQQSQSPSGSSSTGMLSMANAATSDPAKAIAAATALAAAAAVSNNNKKGSGPGSGIQSQGSPTSQPSGQQQHLASSFAYMHVVPAGVPTKPAQQKQQEGE